MGETERKQSLRRLSGLGSGVEIDAVDERIPSRVRLVECGGRIIIVVHVEKLGKVRTSSIQRGRSEMSRAQGAWGVSDAAMANRLELGKYGRGSAVASMGERVPPDGPSEVSFTTTDHERGGVRRVHG